MPDAISGALCQFLYGYETSDGLRGGTVAYGTLSPAINKVFGNGQLPSISRRNNLKKIRGVGQRNVQAIVPLKYEGTVDWDFEVATGAFWMLITGAVANGGAGPTYTHTFTEANTLLPFTLEANFGTSTRSVQRFLGCKMTEITIKSAVGDVLHAHASAPFQKDTNDTTSSNTGTETRDPLTFAGGTINIGGTLADVQSFEFRITQNIEMLYRLGSRFPTQAVEKHREYALKVQLAFESVAEALSAFWGATTGATVAGPTNQASVTLTFTNNGSGADLDQHVLTLANVQWDSEKLSANPEEISKEDFDLVPKSLTSVVVTDGTTGSTSYP